jgi:hypothetical protein
MSCQIGRQTRWRPGCRPTQHNALVGISVPPTEEIEVTDPTHPLYGLRLPCLGVTNKQVLGRACVVWLARGIERLIPVAATSLAGPSSPASPCRLSMPAVRTLLAVLASAGIAAAPPPGQEDADVTDRPTTDSAPAAVGLIAHTDVGDRPGTAAAPVGLGRPRPAGADTVPPEGGRAVAGGGSCP